MKADRVGDKALHELGNLLAVIAGQAEFLLHQEPGAATDKTPEVLEIIRTAALSGRAKLRELYALTRTPPPESPPPAAALDAAGVRVLVIDDDAALRDAMAGLLRQAGHHVDTAADAAAGIASCGNERFDCVLTDLTMPGMSGLAVSRVIKNKYPDVFVILMTGADGAVGAGLYRAAGVDRLLLKPCGREEILTAVAAARRLAPSL